MSMRLYMDLERPRVRRVVLQANMPVRHDLRYLLVIDLVDGSSHVPIGIFCERKRVLRQSLCHQTKRQESTNKHIVIPSINEPSWKQAKERGTPKQPTTSSETPSDLMRHTCWAACTGVRYVNLLRGRQTGEAVGGSGKLPGLKLLQRSTMIDSYPTTLLHFL